MTLLIKNAKVITPYRILEDHSVFIKEGRVSDIFADMSVQKDCKNILDAKGFYLSPGFIDIHNHGGFGHDMMESTSQALDAMSRFHTKNGVTGFLATTITASFEELKQAVKNTSEYMKVKRKGQAQLLGLYIEGPYFSPEKKGAQPAKYLKEPDIDELEEMIRISENNVKVVSLAPELANACRAVRYLSLKNITVALGHTNATYAEAASAIQSGAAQATHLYNGMRGFSHREPGVLGAVLTDERVRCEMICDGIHIHDAAMALAVKMKGIDNLILISDAMMAAGLKDGEYLLGGQDVTVRDGAARLRDGTLAGSTLTLNKAVYNMVHRVGVSLKDAVRMAALNPARAIKMDKNKGSIEIGKDADLILMDDRLNIQKVIVGGEIL